MVDARLLFPVLVIVNMNAVVPALPSFKLTSSITNVGVGKTIGVAVGVAVGVFVGVAVGAFVGVAVGVAVGVFVGVAVGVAVGVFVGVAVGVAVGVFVGVAVGVGVGRSSTGVNSDVLPSASVAVAVIRSSGVSPKMCIRDRNCRPVRHGHLWCDW